MRSLKIKALCIRFTRYNCPLYLDEKYKKVMSIRDTDFELGAYYIINLFDSNNQELLRNLLNEKEKSEFHLHFYPHIRIPW